MSDPKPPGMATATPTTPTRPKRTVRKSDYIIQEPYSVQDLDAGGDVENVWRDVDAPELKDADAAIRNIKVRNLTGTFRIVAVKRTIQVESKPVPSTTITDI